MMWAFLNDVFQRIVTFNKLEQRRNLARNLESLLLKPGSKCLDFGCGTALFAPVFAKLNLKYYGYDIDHRLIEYASILYKNNYFTSSWKNLETSAPFDLVLANCCFHHIDSVTLDKELQNISALLSDSGMFVMIDILFPYDDSHWLRKIFRKLEQGAYIRTVDSYLNQVERYFEVIQIKTERSYLLSLNKIPVYNDLLVLTCKKYLQ